MSLPPQSKPRKPYHQRVKAHKIADLVGCSVAVLHEVSNELRRVHLNHIDNGIYSLFQREKKLAGFTTVDLGRLLDRARKHVGTMLKNSDNENSNAKNARVASAARFFTLRNQPLQLPREDWLTQLAEQLHYLVGKSELVWSPQPGEVSEVELGYAVRFFVVEHEQDMADLYSELIDGKVAVTVNDLTNRRKQVFSWMGITQAHPLWDVHLRLGADPNRWRVLYLGLRLPWLVLCWMLLHTPHRPSGGPADARPDNADLPRGTQS